MNISTWRQHVQNKYLLNKIILSNLWDRIQLIVFVVSSPTFLNEFYRMHVICAENI